MSVMVWWILLLSVCVRSVSFESNEGILSSECNGEPLVVAPLAMENLMVSDSNHMEVAERNRWRLGVRKKLIVVSYHCG